MLSEEDRAILDFERASCGDPGPKDLTIELTLGLTAAEYYRRLLAILEIEAALAYDPLTVKRVSRIVEQPRRSELAV
jgi:Protein of unknown function (DUF3263)